MVGHVEIYVVGAILSIDDRTGLRRFLVSLIHSLNWIKQAWSLVFIIVKKMEICFWVGNLVMGEGLLMFYLLFGFVYFVEIWDP